MQLRVTHLSNSVGVSGTRLHTLTRVYIYIIFEQKYIHVQMYVYMCGEPGGVASRNVCREERRGDWREGEARGKDGVGESLQLFVSWGLRVNVYTQNSGVCLHWHGKRQNRRGRFERRPCMDSSLNGDGLTQCTFGGFLPFWGHVRSNAIV